MTFHFPVGTIQAATDIGRFEGKLDMEAVIERAKEVGWKGCPDRSGDLDNEGSGECFGEKDGDRVAWQYKYVS